MALGIIANILPIVEVIVQTGKEIKHAAARVQANKEQSKLLSESISTIIGFLNPDKLAKVNNGHIYEVLRRFLQFLKRCLEFIKKFTNSNWFSRVFQNGNHAKQFRALNDELNRHCRDLGVGLSLHQYQEALARTGVAAEQDLVVINTIVEAAERQATQNLNSNSTPPASSKRPVYSTPKRPPHRAHTHTRFRPQTARRTRRTVQQHYPLVPRYFY